MNGIIITAIRRVAWPYSAPNITDFYIDGIVRTLVTKALDLPISLLILATFGVFSLPVSRSLSSPLIDAAHPMVAISLIP